MKSTSFFPLITIWRLVGLMDWVAYLKIQLVALQSMHVSIDTITYTGKLIFHLFTAAKKPKSLNTVKS